MRSKQVFYGILMGLLWHPYKISMMSLYIFFFWLLWDLYRFSLVFYWISMVLLWDLEKVPMGFP